ncbi:MAG: hypothetical protein KA477_01565, partial [Candidatus Levybacteria bacterium]|nr:hypothetical protein [Candidatus Levybacteria bacterium]
MSKQSSSLKRHYWGRQTDVLPQLELLSIQKESYQWLLDVGIKEVIDEISPIEDFTGKNWELTLGNHRLGDPTITEELALQKGLT